jgi:HAD superfamily hydrolase (TIGR01662 family)
MASVVAVVFDVGETLIDETEAWGGWADWLAVPRLTLFATLGAVIARGGHHSDALRMVRPGIDVDAETRARDAAGRGFRMTADDLYPDALPCLRALAAAGIEIGIAGNQPASTETLLRALDVPLALVASSQTWDVEKPDPAFFARICEELRLSAAEVVYVGDRLDNDVGGAAAAGMKAVFLRRGPWAIIQSASQDPFAAGAAATIDSLAELPDVVARLRAAEAR